MTRYLRAVRETRSEREAMHFGLHADRALSYLNVVGHGRDYSGQAKKAFERFQTYVRELNVIIEE
jgi:hypothetical protein